MSLILERLVQIAKERLLGTWEPTERYLTESVQLRDVLDGHTKLPKMDMHNWVTTNCGFAACIIGHGLLDERTHADLVHPDHETLERLVPHDAYAEEMAAELGMDTGTGAGPDLEVLLFAPSSYDEVCASTDLVGVLTEFIRRAELLLEAARDPGADAQQVMHDIADKVFTDV